MVPFFLLIGPVMDSAILATRPSSSAVTDQWSHGVIPLIFAPPSLTLTFITSALLVPRGLS